MRKLIKRLFRLFDISDLAAGGNCGLCGRYIPNQVFEKEWRWGVCQKCADSIDERREKQNDKRRN